MLRITQRSVLSIAALTLMLLAAAGSLARPPETSPPARTPTDFKATVVSGTQVDLSWNGASDEWAYLVERCEGVGCASFVQIGNGHIFGYQDKSVAPAISYSYRVRARGGMGSPYSAYTNTLTVATPDTTAPSAPANLTASAASASQINLSWLTAVDTVGVAGYQLERCTGPSCSSYARIATPPGASYLDSSVSTATAYRYRVRAYDAAGNVGGYSNEVAVTTPDNQPPSAPANVSAMAASSTLINLSWSTANDNVGVATYLIERCAGVNCSSFAQINTATTSSFADSGVTSTISYSYRIRAVDAAGNASGYSTTATATTPAPPDTQAPSAPGSLAASPTSSAQVNVSWAAATDNVAVTAYLLERCQGAGCTSFSALATVSGTSHSDTSVAATTTYGYRVRARDAANNLSPYSSVAYATTPASSDTTAPTVPTALMVTASSDKEIRLAWTASTDTSGVTGYQLERCQGSSCSNFIQVGVPSGTTFNDIALATQTTYRYRVRARDSAGNLSGYSTALTAMTAPPGPTCQ